MGAEENKKLKKISTSSEVEELVEKAGGCLVIDGGFATQLQTLGADIDDPLWSAVCLISNPKLIEQVHLQYLDAGCDVLLTSSYQASIPGFIAKGLTAEEGEFLLQKSVKLAIEARDKFWKTHQKMCGYRYNRALVAASVGSYGAYLADGSEYNGCYSEDVTLQKLKDFHRRRLQVLVHAGPDLLAFETIPNKLETQAIVDLLDEENIRIPSWICFSSTDGEHVASGETFEDCFSILNKNENVAIIGINCSPPQFIEGLISKFKKVIASSRQCNEKRGLEFFKPVQQTSSLTKSCSMYQLTEKLIAVYPNSGEVYDGRAKKWLACECYGEKNFGVLAKRWRECGASFIGGCCRTTPSTIQSISKVLKDC